MAFSTPLIPHSWGLVRTQRGFAPLHALVGGTGEAKLARDTQIPPSPRSASGGLHRHGKHGWEYEDGGPSAC